MKVLRTKCDGLAPTLMRRVGLTRLSDNEGSHRQDATAALAEKRDFRCPDLECGGGLPSPATTPGGRLVDRNPPLDAVGGQALDVGAELLGGQLVVARIVRVVPVRGPPIVRE